MVLAWFKSGADPGFLKRRFRCIQGRGRFHAHSVWGGTLIFSYIHRLGPIFSFKILNFNTLGGGGVREMNIFWGMKILWIFFWGHHKIGLF